MASSAPTVSGSSGIGKPRLSVAQIFNMSIGFLGIQFGFALQNGNASRILQVFGADVEHLSWFWLVAPITGMIVQPIIGHYSDQTWNRLGRRRPYFLTGAIIAAAGLMLMPNAGMFVSILPALWVGAGMLMIMDASFNVAMEPFRALVADKLPDQQRTLGYSVQTGLIGFGAVLGSWLPYILAKWMGVKEVAQEGKVPDNVIYSFIIGALVLIIAIVWTVVTTKEYPPELQRKYTGDVEDKTDKKGLSQILVDFKKMPKTMRQLGLVQFFSWFGLFSMWVFSTPGITRSKYDMTISNAEYGMLQQIVNNINADSSATTINHPATQAEKEESAGKLKKAKEYFTQSKEYINEGNGKFFIESNLASYFLSNKILPEKDLVNNFYTGLKQNNNSSKEYTSTIKELETLQKNFDDGNSKNDETISYSSFVYAFKNAGITPVDSVAAKLSLMSNLKRVVQQYNEGANWVSGLLGIYNGISAVFAFFLPFLARRLGRKATHAFALICGGIGLLSIFFISNPNMLIISMVGIGIAWASILAMPYVILSSSIPAGKMGIYMGIFNFFITIPQIINGIFGGPIVKNIFNNHPIYALVVAGIFMLCAAVCVLFVYDAGGIHIRKKDFSEAEIRGSGPAV